MRVRLALLGVLATASLACDAPRDSEVAAAFRAEYPAFEVIGVSSGEGDGSTVYKHIRYRRPSATAQCEVVWGYQQAEPDWRVFYKSQARLDGAAMDKPCG